VQVSPRAVAYPRRLSRHRSGGTRPV